MAATLRTKLRSHSLTGLAHSLLWPIIAVLFLGWVVELVGVAGLQHTCADSIFIGSPQFAMNAQLPSGLLCRQVYRWLWWTVVLQVVVLMAVIVIAGVQLAHPGSWLGIVGLLSTVTVMQMWSANVAINMKDALAYGEGLLYARTAFAGFVIGAFADYMLMLAIGFASSLSFNAHGDGHGEKVDDHGHAEKVVDTPVTTVANPTPEAPATVQTPGTYTTATTATPAMV